ncbi:peptidoglycan DD-metalloendopeptidase family protein, partial [Candidatus Pacearchaeota archaeon]|nr:peptidoglycan DD-metalloendopeptidase family protein [Candidatus Pacearchaeota archaeon]
DKTAEISLPSDEDSAFEAYRESIIENWGGKRAFTESRLEGIKTNLEDEKKNFHNLEREIDTIEDKLEPIRKEIETLKKQIDLLNKQLVESKTKIKNVEFQVAEKQILLKDLMWDLNKSSISLDIQREVVLDYVLLVYQEEEQFLDFYDDSSSTLKLLLADNSVSENLLGREYSEVLESTGRKLFYDLHDKKVDLENKQLVVEEERDELDSLYHSLNQERRILKEGRGSKKDLLEKTRGEEEEFQKLLDESIQQQLQSAIAIQNMQDNIEYIEEKLDLLDESLERVELIDSDSEEAQTLLAIEEETEEKEDEITDEFEGDIDEEVEGKRQHPLSWPIPPVAVTAYFEDPTYPSRWGVHKAADLRAKQFTEIVSPANAYVFQTKDNGMGYSYIILAHKNKLITVYGHVSEILVKAGTVVKEGEVIGLSGGTPGTKGAGWQTTGPHLHFEVWHKGEQVDPLNYLPIFELPIEYIPNRFLDV